MGPSWILIDANNLAHMAKHSMKGLSYQAREVGVIYGFLLQILKIGIKFKCANMAFCWDSKKSLRRLLCDRGYKANRLAKKKERTREEKELDRVADRQFRELRKYVLKDMGFKNVFLKAGFEADDIIAYLVQETDPGHGKVIVSSDHDLLQLLYINGVRIYHPKGKRVIDVATVLNEKEIHPEFWHMVLAIAGDPGDGVIGAKGVGEKTAIKYLKGEFEKAQKKPKAVSAIEDEWDRLMLNVSLVKLPFEEWNFEVPLQKHDLELHRFRAIFKEYGFRSFLGGYLYEQWKEFVEYGDIPF